MTKTRSFLAITLASLATCGLLLSGCGGGSGGVVTPTNTPLPTSTPIPAVPIGTATANLNVVTTATDDTTFGDATFVIPDGLIIKTESAIIISYFGGTITRHITLSGINLATATVGTSYPLGSISEMSASYGFPVIATWGGVGKCTGSLVVKSVERKKVTFQLQNVVLSQSSGSGSNGNSTLAVTGVLTATQNQA